MPTSNLSASLAPNEVNVVPIDISFALSSFVIELDAENVVEDTVPSAVVASENPQLS